MKQQEMYKMGEKKMEVTEKMTEFQLEKAATLKTIAIRAKKVGEMVDFYKKVMGFVLKSEENNLSIWGTREAGTQLLPPFSHGLLPALGSMCAVTRTGYRFGHDDVFHKRDMGIYYVTPLSGNFGQPRLYSTRNQGAWAVGQ